MTDSSDRNPDATPVHGHLAHAPATESTFTESVDRLTGALTASGRLDSRAADMLGATVEAMSRSGSAPVRLHLGGVDASDAAGRHALRSLEERIEAAGALVVGQPRIGEHH